MTDSGYYALAGAIIEQACKDFRSACKILKSHPDSEFASDSIREITRFFCSDYFSLLTDIDGPWLLMKLKEEVMPNGVHAA